MNLIYPKVKNFNKIIPYIFWGLVIASVYGAIHDQVTYAISPEYFTELKFKQFSYADFQLGNRVFASTVGILATFWFGALAGWFLGRFRFYHDNTESAHNDIIHGFKIIFVTAFIGAVLGGTLGFEISNNYLKSSFLGWEQILPKEKFSDFIRVTLIHYGGYIGGFSGMIYSCLKLKKL